MTNNIKASKAFFLGIVFLVVIYSCVLGPSLARADLVKVALVVPVGMTKAEIYTETSLPASHGVVVLCPGMNGDGKMLVAEGPWHDFAKSRGLGLVGVSFSSPPEQLYGNPARGYYYPEQGSGELLISALHKIYGQDVKLFIYGFSGGAQFTSRFVDQHPELIISWAAYAACFWSTPLSATPKSAPGIVACGEYDTSRYGPSYAFFQQGRRRDARWLWLSLGNTGHARQGEFEKFIRLTFAAVLAGDFKNSTWLDAETKQPTTEDERLLNPALSVWLPTPEIKDAWLKLHHP